MDAKRIKTVLETMTTVSNQQTRAGWMIAKCPLAPWTHSGGVDNNPSFAVKIDEHGDPLGNCFSCGAHGKLSDWVMEVAGRNKIKPSGRVYDFKEARHQIELAEQEAPLLLDQTDLEQLFHDSINPDVEFPEWWLDSYSQADDLKWARDYLKARGVTNVMSGALDLRASVDVSGGGKERRICFPVRDFGGTLRGFHGRAIYDDVNPRYRMFTYNKQTNPNVWYGEHWVDVNKPIIVVEGPFDVASVKRVYRNVVSPLFANPSVNKIKRMADCEDWVTFLDLGKAGDQGRTRIAQTLPYHNVQHAKPTEGKDPGSMSEQELRDILGSYVDLDKNLYLPC